LLALKGEILLYNICAVALNSASD